MTPPDVTQDDATTRTEPVPVTVRLASGVEVTGNVHVKPDSYHRRVSDMLNRGLSEFLPITEATLERPDGAMTSTDCIIVRREQIEVVVCIDTRLPDGTEARRGDAQPTEEPATQATPVDTMADTGARAAW